MYKQIKTSSTPTNLTEVIQHIIINSIITNSSIPFHTSIECKAMDPPLCARGCGFYGSPATENLCSKCYKCHLKEKEKEAAEAAAAAKNFVLALPVPLARVGSTVSDTDNKSAKVEVSGSRKRCECCNKKVGVIGFDCSRCGGSFCGIHRYPEEHACDFDFKSFGRAVLAKQNPVCKSDKAETRI